MVTTTRRPFLLGAAVIIVALIVVSCGGGDATSTPRPTATPALQPLATAAPTATLEPAATIAPAPTPGAQATPTPRPTSTPRPTAGPGIERGGTIRIYHTGTQGLITFDASNTGVYQTYYILGSFAWNQLLRFDNKTWTDNDVVSDLAVKWESSPDAKQFTFELNPDARWQGVEPVNGRKLVAGDVKWFFDYLMGPDYRGGNKVPFQDVASIEAPDDGTLVIALKDSFVGFPSAMASYTLKILPREQLEQDGDFSQSIVGSGPWIFEKWERGARVVFERNPDYWKLGVDGKALPYIDKVEILMISDEATALALMRTGSLDIYSPNAVQPQVAKKAMRDTPHLNWIVDSKLFADEIHWNMSKEPWKSDLGLRQALMKSVDQDAIAKNVIFEEDAPWEGPITSGMGEFSLPQDEVKQFLRYDPEGAAALLAERGYTPDNPLKFEISFMLPGPPGSQTQRYAEILGPMISATPGFEATVFHPASPAEGFGRIFGNQYDVGKTFVGFEGDIWNWFRNFFFTRGPRNWFNLSDPTLDGMITDFVRTVDRAALPAMAQDIQRYILDQAFLVPLVAGRWYLPQQGRVKNYMRTWGWGQSGIEEAWLEQ